MAVGSMKQKAMTLYAKLYIIQKMAANLNITCSDIYVTFIQFIGGPL
jgi:hypothetical protein